MEKPIVGGFTSNDLGKALDLLGQLLDVQANTIIYINDLIDSQNNVKSQEYNLLQFEKTFEVYVSNGVQRKISTDYKGVKDTTYRDYYETQNGGFYYPSSNPGNSKKKYEKN